MSYWVAGSIVVGGLLGAGGQKSAADTQAGAQNQATQTQLSMFNTLQGNQKPYMQAGGTALNSLMYGLGNGPAASPGFTPMTEAEWNAKNPTSSASASSQNFINPGITGVNASGVPTDAMNPGGVPNVGSFGNSLAQTADGSIATPGASKGTYQDYLKANPATAGVDSTAGGTVASGQFTKGFSPTDFTNNLDPGYGFQLQQGGQAVRNADTPAQGALSGSALKDLMSFNQGLAATGYQNAYNRFQTTQNSIFGRLSGIAGLGQNAAANTGTVGTTLGTGIAQSQAATGAAQAGGQIGVSNAIGGSALPLGYLMSQNNNPPPVDPASTASMQST